MEITIKLSSEAALQLRREAGRRGITPECMALRLMGPALAMAEIASEEECDRDVQDEAERYRRMYHGLWRSVR
jgi:hypothetical protein